MDLDLLTSLISDLDTLVDEYDDKPHGLASETKGLAPRALPALGAQHPRLDEVLGHLKHGLASSALGVLREIQSVA